jgi:hypothetical protein
VSREGQSQDEKELEKNLCKVIKSGQTARQLIKVHRTESTVHNLADLFEKVEPGIIEDSSDWNEFRTLSKDLFWGITPDIVIRPIGSNQNRIIIEVKKDSPFTHKEPDASQVLRYFLHLLVTTDKSPESGIRRAVLLAAPQSWFKGKHSASWDHFLSHYRPLANHFDITLGEIYLDSIPGS